VNAAQTAQNNNQQCVVTRTWLMNAYYIDGLRNSILAILILKMSQVSELINTKD